MQYGLTEEQEMIAATVRAFVENEIYPHEELVERTGTVPPDLGEEIKRKTIALGFYACNFPEEVGGAGLSHREFMLVERELGRGSMALTHFFGRPQNILMACAGEQRDRYLLPAVRGERMKSSHPMSVALRPLRTLVCSSTCAITSLPFFLFCLISKSPFFSPGLSVSIPLGSLGFFP